MQALSSRIDLFWLPLGAGGHFVRLNGRMYESIKALREHRQANKLFHSALEVTVPEGRFVIEDAWPIPDAQGKERGVVVEGDVGSHALGRFRAFRYEIRKWPEGVIADLEYAVASPACISTDAAQAENIIALTETVPPLLWGRDECDLGEMWNSNSVISWLLAGSGLTPEAIDPPHGGRAPGWASGYRLAYSPDPRALGRRVRT
jgi:hypothetical protein